MPTTISHNVPAVFSVLFLLTFGLHLSCARHGARAVSPRKSEISTSTNAVNINTADANELQRIPGIGPVSAKKIVDHRDRYGPFRRPEEILIIDGISEKRFREFRGFILTE
jgi:competence ComEA-like helix-hairpin-helix protein